MSSNWFKSVSDKDQEPVVNVPEKKHSEPSKFEKFRKEMDSDYEEIDLKKKVIKYEELEESKADEKTKSVSCEIL